MTENPRRGRALNSFECQVAHGWFSQSLVRLEIPGSFDGKYGLQRTPFIAHYASLLNGSWNEASAVCGYGYPFWQSMVVGFRFDFRGSPKIKSRVPGRLYNVL